MRLCSQQQCCPHLPGFLFPEVFYLLAEHTGAGLALSGSGLPLLVVVHGLLYGRVQLSTKGAAQPSEWPTVSPALGPEASHQRINTVGSLTPQIRAR